MLNTRACRLTSHPSPTEGSGHLRNISSGRGMSLLRYYIVLSSNRSHTPFLHSSDTMGEQLPLTDPFFAPEEEGNITNNAHEWAFPVPMDLLPPSRAIQEESQPHPETDELVCSTPHSALHLTQMRERRRVLPMATPPPPLQDTAQQASCPDLLVCLPLPRVGGAIDSVQPSSEAENNLGGGTHEHPIHHYTPLLIPVETANVCVFIVPNINFSYPCEDGEVESTHTSGDRSEAVGTDCNAVTETSTPSTQQFVSGQIAFGDVT